MADQSNAVTIKELPKKIDAKQERLFLRDLEGCLNTPRPRIVLDCSHVHTMDGAAVHLLLCCLEEAMKRNGDVRLASIHAEGKAALQSAGVDRLFNIFDTTAEAVDSFRRSSTKSTPSGACA